MGASHMFEETKHAGKIEYTVTENNKLILEINPEAVFTTAMNILIIFFSSFLTISLLK